MLESKVARRSRRDGTPPIRRGRQLKVWCPPELAALLDQRVGHQHGERSAFVRTALRRALRNL